MNEKTKISNIALKIGLILLCVAVVIFLTGFAMMEFDTSKLNNINLIEVDEQAEVNGLTKLEIDFDESNIAIVSSNDDFATIKGFRDERAELIITTEGDTLKISLQLDIKWYIYIGFFNFSNERLITISLPKNIFEVFNIVNMSGDIDISGFNLKTLKIDDKSGRVSAVNISAATIDINCTSGKITLQNILSDKMDLHCTSGNTNVTSTKITGNLNAQSLSGKVYIYDTIIGGTLTASCTSGRVEVESAEIAGEVNLRNTSGKTYITNVKCSKLTAKSTSGGVRLSKLDAEDINIECNSGSVTGTIIGQVSDYRISSSVNSGGSNLPSTTTGTRSLIVKVTSGSISISFVSAQ